MLLIQILYNLSKFNNPRLNVYRFAMYFFIVCYFLMLVSIVPFLDQSKITITNNNNNNNKCVSH